MRVSRAGSIVPNTAVLNNYVIVDRDRRGGIATKVPIRNITTIGNQRIGGSAVAQGSGTRQAVDVRMVNDKIVVAGTGPAGTGPDPRRAGKHHRSAVRNDDHVAKAIRVAADGCCVIVPERARPADNQRSLGTGIVAQNRTTNNRDNTIGDNQCAIAATTNHDLAETEVYSGAYVTGRASHVNSRRAVGPIANHPRVGGGGGSESQAVVVQIQCNGSGCAL